MFEFVLYCSRSGGLIQKKVDGGTGGVFRIRNGRPAAEVRERRSMVDLVVRNEFTVDPVFIAECRKGFRIERIAENHIRLHLPESGLKLLHRFLIDISFSDPPDRRFRKIPSLYKSVRQSHFSRVGYDENCARFFQLPEQFLFRVFA